MSLSSWRRCPHNSELWQGYYETTTHRQEFFVFFHYRICKVPCQDDKIIWLVFVQVIGMDDRNVKTRRKKTLLKRVIISDETHYILSDSEMIHQCCSFCRCTVSCYSFTSCSEARKKSDYLVSRRINRICRCWGSSSRGRYYAQRNERRHKCPKKLDIPNAKRQLRYEVPQLLPLAQDSQPRRNHQL